MLTSLGSQIFNVQNTGAHKVNQKQDKQKSDNKTGIHEGSGTQMRTYTMDGEQRRPKDKEYPRTMRIHDICPSQSVRPFSRPCGFPSPALLPQGWIQNFPQQTLTSYGGTRFIFFYDGRVNSTNVHRI